MAKDKRPKGESSSSTSKITDPRFKNFEEDPRFRLPSKRSTKVKLDKRFSKILTDEDNEFTSIATVDRYGRKIKPDKKKKVLQRLYQAEDDDEDEDEDEDKHRQDKRKVDADEVVRRELEAANKKYDPARQGGYSSSDESSDEEDEEDEDALAISAGLERFQDEQANVETGEVTSRFAVVNLDWDHVNSTDLFALLRSFLPATGRVQKVTVYPSSFGKERMDREDLEGPPKELFKKAKDDDEEDDAEEDDEEVKKQLLQEGEEQEFDNDALRTYQLERLRYYFAVVELSDPTTAKAVYDKVDGTEYLSSSNFMDLRFIPDDLTFDDEPRDSATDVPGSYKPVEFVTDALFNSKVKLSWDVRQDEGSRNELMQKAFTGSRADMAENDLKAYLASEGSDSGEGESDFGQEEPEAEQAGEDEPPLSKKELARRKMRAALGLTDEPAPKKSKDAPVGEMQITFTSALSEKDSSKNKAPEEETTIEKYKRKERERKAKKKEKVIAKRTGVEPSAEDQAEPGEQAEDLGFDDPFFTTEEPAQASKSAVRKEERLKKRAAKEAEAAEQAAEKANLELILADNADGTTHLDHFDMNEIRRAEKEKKKGKKGKKSKKQKEDRGGLQQDFQLNTADSRFQAVFHEHEFAIDPSNPRFKETESMKKILEEGRKKRKGGPDDESADPKRHSKKTKAGDEDLSGLISAIKKKSSRK